MNRFVPVCVFLSVFLVALFVLVYPAMALEPSEILVIANKNASESLGLARYYMEQRKIPKKNLLTLWLTDKETCTREVYLKKVAVPVRRYLDSVQGQNIRCLVTMYGIPLKISPPDPVGEESLALHRFENEKKRIEERLADMKTDEPSKTGLTARLKKLNQSLKSFNQRNDKWAALDSELTLVTREDYPLGFWLANPFYYPLKDQSMPLKKSDITMVCRLDGPDARTVKRVIADSIYAETNGLAGIGYFDARWVEPPNDKSLSGYALNDKLIHLAAGAVKQSGLAENVVIDDTGRLFQPGECPNAALYCGWYSLANYVDAFTWNRGAVGFHVASSECATLRAGTSNVWCKRMLERGIAATVGPVGEPYVQSFPNAEIFFRLLCDGYLSLVECYYVSLPFVSWKMVLVGDPLYRPYKKFRK
ncbi:hypothetical protein HRM2_13290 [Desulforapulum autotrophicum HRM2]|uniref:TIGR03790 family protein n=1 Tax=Desulforapulum autotrophicum (strain ATCC 43914 / DSM 3382 / VKM B-1955 / HRM2) TaxID=177437 RepID=C0Q8V0_DESAH|nr:TIGR03790 family protein [Desulforapulum autotrophicum]ACN14440.1 hypothetical protein HRM2_13290 [Desulforapulum autotrophicum HRM2]